MSEIARTVATRMAAYSCIASSDEALQVAAVDPVYFAVAFLNWHPHLGQAWWLWNATCPENYLRAGNRWGKTEGAIAIKHLWLDAFKIRDPFEYDPSDPYYTANVAMSLDQASLALNKAWLIVHREENEDFRKCFISRRVGSPFPRIEYNHGSVWWARSTSRKGAYLEGYDFDHVTYDEAAFDPDFDYVRREVLLIRLLDRGGKLDCISTGKRGSEFNRQFKVAQESPESFAYQGKTTDNPHLDKAALERAMAGLDKGLILERIMGGERPSDGTISVPLIMAAINRGKGLQPKRLARRYSTGWDLAKQGNYVVGVTLDITEQPYQLVAWEMFNKHDFGEPDSGDSYWQKVIERIIRRREIYGGQTFVDATGIGSVVLDVGGLNRIGAEAIVFTTTVLAELIGCLELAFGRGLIGIPFLEKILFDGSTWTLTNELEQVSDKLSGLDTATAIALALWGVRSELRSEFTQPLNPRVRGVKVKGR